jgi:O-antigen ligase
MVFIGIFMVCFSVIELLFNYNIFAVLLSDFIELVGSSAFLDPLQKVEAHLAADFYRLLGPQVESTEMAIVAFLAFIFCLTWPDQKSPQMKKLTTVMLFLLSALIIVNSSRAVILAVLAVVISNYVILNIRKGRRLSALTITTIMIGLLIAVTIIINYAQLLAYLDRIGVTATFAERIEDEGTILIRLWIWDETLNLIRENLWVGIGFAEIDMPTMSDVFSSHNYILDLLMHHGIFLTIFLNIIFFIMAFRSLRLLKNKYETIQSASQVFLLLGLTMMVVGLANPEKPQLAAIFWFFGGLVNSFWQREAQNYA